MVEREGKIDFAPGENADIAGVVPCVGRAPAPSDEDGGDRMLAGVAAGIGICMQLPKEPDVERGLLARFPDGGAFERFPVIDESARQSPAVGRVPALDEHDSVLPPGGFEFDDQVDRRYRVSIDGLFFGGGHIAPIVE